MMISDIQNVEIICITKSLLHNFAAEDEYRKIFPITILQRYCHKACLVFIIINYFDEAIMKKNIFLALFFFHLTFSFNFSFKNLSLLWHILFYFSLFLVILASFICFSSSLDFFGGLVMEQRIYILTFYPLYPFAQNFIVLIRSFYFAKASLR